MLARPLLALSTVLLACAHVDRVASAPVQKPETTRTTERILFVDGVAGRLRVSDGGSGEPAVVFVHGLGGDLEVWRAQLDHLRAHRRAIAYDQRGHGESERAKDGVYTVDALAGDLEVVVKTLGLQRFTLVGHSFSGTVITAYAAAHPERVAGLVYVDAVGDFASLGCEEVARSFAKELLPPSAQRSGGPLSSRGSAPRRARPRANGWSPRSIASISPRSDACARAWRGSRGRIVSLVTAAQRWRFEVEGKAPPFRASAALGVSRVDVAGVSHWVMMDDPEAFDRALDPFLGIPPAR